MTVTGATTAGLAAAGAYTAPYKYVTSAQNPVQVTGTITSPISNNPSVTAGTSDGDYAWAYLQAHMMSPPSYRYAYLMWCVFALIAIIYAISHHLRLSGGSIGASFAAFGMRRHTLGSKKPGSRNRALPSNNVILTIVLLSAVAIVLSLIGADYIKPSSSILDFSTSFSKRASASPTAPQYTISKAFWTLGSRFGYMAFALFPLVILFALKSAPIGFLSLRVLTQLHSDKLALLHRGVAWLIWAVTTAHVVLWTVQLFQDSRNGKPTWIYLISNNYRFIFGCVAYFCLTALMLLSLRPVRKNKYELFYIAHVVFAFLTLASCVVHHPVLWYWIAAAAGLWGLERAFRLARFAKTNGLFGKKKTRSPLQAGQPYANIPTSDNAYGMSELKPAVDPSSPYRYADKTLPKMPAPSGMSRSSTEHEFGTKSNLAYYDEGSLQPLGSYESRYADPYRDGASTPRSSTLVPSESMGHERIRSSISTAPGGMSFPAVLTPPDIPVGFAQAQLLPSRTIRLTIRVARPFRWAPGQSCLLYLPNLSRIQSHPFSIINNGEDEIVILVKARKGLTRRLYNLVRSKSLALMGVEAQKDKRLSLTSMRGGGEGAFQVPPVHIRARVDGPFGSSARVRWHEFSTVVIICGGSGVSFGASVCDYVCQMMAKRGGTSKVKTQRVRFCWVAREYAEIAWVAGQLYRCQQMVPAVHLEISIFVTKAQAPTPLGDFALPTPGFAKANRRDSSDSLASDLSRDSPMDFDESTGPLEDHSTQYADILDLTNYDDEEDVNDPAEQQLSDKLQHQGKVRRARSRKAAKAARGGSSTPRVSSVYPPHQPRPRQPSMLGLDAATEGRSSRPTMYVDDVAGQYAEAAEGHHGLLTPEGRRPFGSRYSMSSDAELPLPRPISNDQRRSSFRSIADSTYGRYDPYGGMGGHGAPSPSPSMLFDDNASMTGESVRNLLSRASRTGSMILLEDNPGDIGGDAGLWIDQADYAAMNVMSEAARPGKPKLGAVLEEEIERAQGAMIVATCGPVTLNTVVRNLVAKHISPAKIRHGDKRGHIAIYSEDYES